MDLGGYAGQQFLIAVDHCSGWPWAFHMGKTACARDVTAAIREIFCTSGAPDVIYTDQGPQFMARECQKIFEHWGVEHITSSPHYPQSNGRAEAAVKSMKKLIRRTWDFKRGGLNMEKWTEAIIQYKNTPDSSGLSPTQRLFGQPIQDMLPAHWRSFAPEWQKKADEADRC